jgi:hypothetical protein
MRRRARTDLCGGRFVRTVPTATLAIPWLESELPKILPAILKWTFSPWISKANASKEADLSLVTATSPSSINILPELPMRSKGRAKLPVISKRNPVIIPIGNLKMDPRWPKSLRYCREPWH